MGPSSTDAPQQVKIIEDLIARKVNAITIVPNDANVLEPVFKKARDAGIVVLTNESPGQPSANWDIEIIDNEKFAAEYVEHMAKRMGGKGGYVIYVGSLTVPQHNLWADLLVKYQKEHYPDMHEVTRRMPVAESVDDSRRTTLDLMKTYPDLKAVVSFGSNGPIGAGRAVKEKRAKNKVAVWSTKTISTHFINPFLRGESPDSYCQGMLWKPSFPFVISTKRFMPRERCAMFLSTLCRVRCTALPGKTAVVNRR